MFSWINKYFFDYRVKALCKISCSIFLFASLVSYNMSDPSFNTSTGDYPANLVGMYGLYVADLLLQIFGVSSLLLPICMFCWGMILFYKCSIKWWLVRSLSLIIAMIAFSSYLGCIDSKSMPAGLGG